MNLQDLINDTRVTSFEEDYQDKITNADALGVLIARYFKWDGTQILDCLQSALEDANFHSINEEITNLREKEEV